MHLGGGLLAGLQQALNLGGMSALIAGVFLLLKGKGDAKLTLVQLRQKTEHEDRAADQADVQIMSDQRTQAAAELEKTLLRLAADRDYWEARAIASEKERDYRNGVLADFGTNYIEMFRMMAVPGAMDALRQNRDAQQSITTTITQITTTEPTH